MPRFFPGKGQVGGGWAYGLACLLGLALSGEYALAGNRCDRFYRKLKLPPLTIQRTEYTCGAACVVSLVRQLLGKALSESHVAAAIGTNRSVGTTPEKMLDGLGLLGLKMRVSRETALRELEANYRRGKGQVLLVQSGDSAHWVVLADYRDGRITVMDPWRENTDYLTYTEEELLALWDTSLMGKKIRRLALVTQ